MMMRIICLILTPLFAKSLSAEVQRARLGKLRHMNDCLVVHCRLRTDPPLGNIRPPQQPRDSSENGIRQISREECRAQVSQWLKESTVAAGPEAIERLELLLALDRLADIMPGSKPKRSELLAFGSFTNGILETIAGVLWSKLTLPNEMVRILSRYE